MVSMLDVIRRSSSRFDYIINKRNDIYKDIKTIINDNSFNKIVFVGSGSSYSTVLSTYLFVEKATGLDTFVMFPNLFIEKHNYDRNTLYVFVSQSGTSSLTIKACKKVTDLGFNTLALCGEKDSPLVKAAKYFIEIAVGYEEYSYSTLGFSCSMLAEILLGIEIGYANKHLGDNEYNDYINELNNVIITNANNIDKTIDWFNLHKDTLLNYQNFVFYGGKSLYGIATEGALKIMEITMKYVSIGYEMDDGMHGPNYCLDERTCVFALDDDKDNKNARSIMRLMKTEYKSGYMIGLNVLDNNDLKLDIRTYNFTNLEIIPFVQVLAYSLAKENDIEILQRNDPKLNKTKGKGYFDMHKV